MEDANGSLKGPKAMNGVNGSIKSTLNGHAVGPRRRTRPTGPGFFSQSLGLLARLLTWYSILTVIFRCPATLDTCDETSPRICRPYFQLRHAVSPHLEPYYDTYAAPYVELVRPYYHTLDQRVISPGWGYAAKYGAPRIRQAQAYGKAQWEKNVQPQIVKYQHSAKAQYERALAPHVNRFSAAIAPYYDIARTNALQTYHELLLPSYRFVQPYAQQGYLAASAFTTGTAVPSALWAWNKTYVFLDGTVWPQLRAIYVENVEPQLVKIGQRLGRYNGQKAGAKPVADSPVSSSTRALSSFAKPTPSASASTVATSLPTATPSINVAPGSDEEHTTTEPARTRSTAEPVPPPEEDELENEDPVRRSARETVAADLKDWQERYAKAADEGAAEIDDRVDEITKRMLRRNARVTGKSLLERLQSATVSELVTLRRDILNIVGAVTKGSATPDEGREQVTAAVRRAGLAIKQKAQDVRTWRENYEAEMQTAITKAAEAHFAILENIRDLALQKIGMKWAWMDGVTYKDWAKYHLLKSRFDEWRGELENLIVTHPGLEAAQLEGADIEEEAMKVAASAAKELARLKQVANWKIVAGDDSAEFDSSLMQQAAEAAEAAKLASETLIEKLGDSTSEAWARVEETVERATELPVEAASAASESVREAKDSAVDKVQHMTKSVGSAAPISEASASLESVLSEASEPAERATSVGKQTVSSISQRISSLVNDAPRSAAENAASEASTAISAASEQLSSSSGSSPETTPHVAPGVNEVISETGDSLGDATPDLASTVILPDTAASHSNNANAGEDDDTAEPNVLPIEDAGIERTDAAAPTDSVPVSVAAPPIKPAFLGAAAQYVPSRQPILDDDALDDVSSAMESMRDDLKAAYSSAISHADDQYSRALSVVSVQVHGTPKPVHEQMLASVTSAYSNAMASASARLDDALNVAQERIYGKPSANKILPTAMPTAVSMPSIPSVEWARIESIAADRLQQGRDWAEEQYESAKIAVGLATPTPSTPAEHVSKALDNARHNYYAGLGIAHARYSDFLAAASSAFSSVTATPTPTDLAGSVSSMASVASESAASAVSIAGDNASSVASAASASVSSAASVVGESVSARAAAGYENAAAAADKVAESWDAVIDRISVQIYGAPTPTPWYYSLYNAAGECAASATDAAGEYVASATGAVGEGASSVTSIAGTCAAAASEEAAKQYSVVSSIMSELLVGKEPTFSESVYSRLSSAYVTGVSSASSLASAAQASASSAVNEAGEAVKSAGEKVASAAREATEAVKETAGYAKDEL